MIADSIAAILFATTSVSLLSAWKSQHEKWNSIKTCHLDCGSLSVHLCVYFYVITPALESCTASSYHIFWTYSSCSVPHSYRNCHLITRITANLLAKLKNCTASRMENGYDLAYGGPCFDFSLPSPPAKKLAILLRVFTILPFKPEFVYHSWLF